MSRTPQNSHTSLSVLTKTISDILNISENDKEKVWSSFESLEFRQLDLPSKEWDRLYWHGIYREDSLENILAFSMGYICKLWNEESKFNEIITAILNLMGHVLDRDIAIQVNDIGDENNIFDDNQIEALNGLIISPTFIPPGIMDSLYGHGILKWRDIAEFSEKQIIKRFGFTVKALNLINCLLELYPLSGELFPHILSSDKNIEKDSFELLIRSWILYRKEKERYAQILMQRMGWQGNKAETLEFIAQQHGVTRERIRQIENKLTAKLLHPKAVRALLSLWIVIDSLLQSSNGIISVSELAELLQHHYKWEEKPTFSGLNNLIRFCPKTIIRRNSCEDKKGIIFSKNFSCGDCQDIYDYLIEILTLSGEMSIDDVTERLNVFCKTECSREYTPKFMFSKSFVTLLLIRDSTLKKKLRKKEGMLYHIDTWKLRHGRISNVAETVLKQSGRAMHFTEIFSEMKKIRPGLLSIKERNVYATLDRLPSVLLWDRGTFIHKKNTVFPYGLIRKVEKWVNVKLEQNIPFISIHGAFREFQNLCIHERIPSEYALYSCLRVSGEQLFAFPHFPFIYLNRDEIERIPMPLTIEEFIKEAGGPVSMNEIREFAIEGINVKQFMLNQYIDRAPNIIRIKRGTYLHTDYLKIEEQKLSEIISYARSIISKEDHVSVKKIFNDQKINCKLMGIHSPEALFSVLRLKASDRIHVQSYPQIRLMGGNDTERRGIFKEISLYISNKKAPCSIQELYEHYVEHLGYNEQTIYWATYGDEIYHYLRACVIHKDTIDWTEEKQEQMERVARDIYKQSVKAGSCYGLIDTLIESDALPQLGNNVYWTQLLISDLLKCQNNFIVIGSRNNVFLPLPNEFGIQTFEDFLYEILKRDYNGAINLEILNEELADSGIIAKGVTKNMLDKSTKVTIVGHEIMLTELAQHA